MEPFITRIKTNLGGTLQMTDMFDGLLMTGDNLANRIIVELYRDYVKVPIEQDTLIECYIIRNDGTTVTIAGEVTEEGDALVDIPDVAYTIEGPISIAIRRIKGEIKQVIAAGNCYIRTTESNSIIDVYHRIPDVQELLSYIETLDQKQAAIDTAEEGRVAAENGRVAAENIRAQNDTTWQANEQARVSAESARASAETTRLSNETSRVSAETARDMAEQGRASAETVRVSAETARASAEQLRDSAEAARVIAESNRVQAETTRESNEATRIQNESQRQTNTAAAIQKINDMTVEVVQQENYTEPTVTITEVNGHKHLRFGFAPGNPFVIQKIFQSVAAMNAYDGTDIRDGQFAIIDSNVDDPDNAKMYLKTSDGYVYITDLSGAQGIRGPQGETGNGIANVVLNQDYTLTVNYTDGTSETTSSIRGEKGETGNGIASVVLNQDYTLTINYTDGTSTTTGVIRGLQGETGATGATGNGIASTVLNSDYTLTFTFTDGTSYTTDPIRGVAGQDGTNGTDGTIITSVTVNNDYTMTFNFSNGITYTTPFSMRGPKGEPGDGGVDMEYNAVDESISIIFG